MKKNLIIDGQIFQSIARHRGMGRYSEYLLGAIIKKSSYKSITIILSDINRGELDAEEELGIFEGAAIQHLDLVDSGEVSLAEAELHNTNVLNGYIKNRSFSKQDTDYLLLAPFQEPLVSVFPDNVSKFLVFYDLIPYLYHEQYIHKMPFEKYLTHYKLLFQADKLLAISESVKNDICLYLGVHESKVEAIHGAAVRSSNAPSPVQDFVLPEKFILMPTGDDPRKNNTRGVEGFELFNAKNNNEFKLVITSNIHFSERIKLQKLSDNLIFTGNLDEAELDWLYDKSDVVIFVSESEGLGLPILEAVGANSKVVASSIDVFREISHSAFFYCDETSPDSISQAIELAVKSKLDAKKKNEYKRILSYYSWEETAGRAITAMQQTAVLANPNKKKIAVFTPQPNGISAIGKVVAETHPTMLQYFDVDYFYEEGPEGVNTRPNYLQYVANYYPAANFSVDAYADYDAVFYHIGNSEYHLHSIANGLYLPGYVIVHDTNISDAYRVMAERDLTSRSRMDLENEITRVGGFKLSNNLASLVTNQIGLMTHSSYALDALAEISKSLNARKVNLPTNVPTIDKDRDYEGLSIGLAGIIADIKGTEVIESLVKNPLNDAHNFLLFGFNYSADSTIKRLKSYKNVRVETNVTDLDFVKKMKELDVFVNYRMKYQGETSLSTLEAMRQGVVVIVRNVGWYSELPDDAVIKVGTIGEVADVINELNSSPERLKRISANAIRYIRDSHGHDNYAKGMLALISEKPDYSEAKNLKVSDALKSRKIKTKIDLMKERGL